MKKDFEGEIRRRIVCADVAGMVESEKSRCEIGIKLRKKFVKK